VNTYIGKYELDYPISFLDLAASPRKFAFHLARPVGVLTEKGDSNRAEQLGRIRPSRLRTMIWKEVQMTRGPMVAEFCHTHRKRSIANISFEERI